MIVVVDPVGAMIVLVLTTAALAALCGYLAGWRQSSRRRAHGYFVLGVLTGLVGHALARRRLGRRINLQRHDIRGIPAQLVRSVSRIVITR